MVTLDRSQRISQLNNLNHQELYKLIGMLQHAAIMQLDKEDVVKILAQFVRKSHLHFIQEEMLFAKHDYPEAENHKEDHRRFVQVLDEMYLNFLAFKIESVSPIAAQLLEMIEEHALHYDSEYARYMTDKVGSTEYAIEI